MLFCNKRICEAGTNAVRPARSERLLRISRCAQWIKIIAATGKEQEKLTSVHEEK